MQHISSRLVKVNFKKPWQFRVEMDEAPPNFDLLVKELSQPRATIDTTPFEAGGKPVNYPTSTQPITIALTCLDTEEEEMVNWMLGRINKVRNKDGTWNLPASYLLNCKIYKVMSDGTEVLRQQLKLIPLTIGDITESVENRGFVEFPMTFIEFSAGTVDF